MHNTLGLAECVCTGSVCRLARSSHCYRKWNGRARCAVVVTLANTIHSAWLCGSMVSFYRGTERQSVRRSIYMLQCAESNIYYSFRISVLSLSMCVCICVFLLFLRFSPHVHDCTSNSTECWLCCTYTRTRTRTNRAIGAEPNWIELTESVEHNGNKSIACWICLHSLVTTMKLSYDSRRRFDFKQRPLPRCML